MSEVKRYELYSSGYGEVYMEEQADGDYVGYEDYEKLRLVLESCNAYYRHTSDDTAIQLESVMEIINKEMKPDSYRF